MSLKVIEDIEIGTAYQPQILLPTHGRWHGAEALIRPRRKSTGESLRPDLFIRDLETSGNIEALHQIFKTILLDACTWAKFWTKKLRRNIVVAVNISPLQLSDETYLVGIVDEMLRLVSINPTLLEIEVTETEMLTDQMIKTLKSITSRGVAVSIDDFGGGFTSLMHIRNHRFFIKVDKHFMLQLTPDDKVIVNLLLTLAREFQIRVVVEGIEGDAQFEFLMGALRMLHTRGLGQGFGISRPKPAPELLSWESQRFQMR